MRRTTKKIIDNLFERYPELKTLPITESIREIINCYSTSLKTLFKFLLVSILSLSSLTS
jgi:hypothetical protein